MTSKTLILILKINANYKPILIKIVTLTDMLKLSFVSVPLTIKIAAKCILELI